MDVSQLRQHLRQTARQIERQIGVLMGHAPLVRGGVYRLRRRCGKAGCRCTRGELHASWVWLGREKGVRRIRPVPPGEAARWRRQAQQYRRYRHARRELLRLCRQALRLARRLEAARAVAPPATRTERKRHA